MSKGSEKDIDKLFQLGSEEYDFEYDPEAWQDMEHLLDQKERRRRWLWWWLSGVSLVGLGIVVFFIFSNGKTGNSAPTSDINQERTEKTHHERVAPPPVTEVETDLDEIGKQGDSLPGPTKTQDGRGTEDMSSASPQMEVSTLPEKSNSLGEVPPVAAKRGGQLEWKPERPIPEPKEATAHLEDKPSMTFREPPVDGRRAALSLEELALIPTLEIPHFPISNEIDTEELPSVDDIDVPKKKGHAFSLGLSGGSEWNSVGFGDFTQQNWKFGLHFEYHFQKKFALGVGATWMRMDYDADEGEYIPEMGFWTDGIAPQSTFGRCDMLELPIQLTYHFNGFKNNGFFLSGGMSSYWILEEHYWYNYDNPRPDLVFYWGTQKDERNWFNLGLFSFGYQKILSPRTAASLEPYIQFPLSGVGHGFVKIYSLGVRAKVDFWMKK